MKVARTNSPDPLIHLAGGKQLEEFRNDDSAEEQLGGLGSRTDDGGSVEGTYELMKYHSFSNSNWATLWTDRFTAGEQRGYGSGSGARSTSYRSSYSGCGYGYGCSYDETGGYIGFRWATFASPDAFNYVYPTGFGALGGGSLMVPCSTVPRPTG